VKASEQARKLGRETEREREREERVLCGSTESDSQDRDILA